MISIHYKIPNDYFEELLFCEPLCITITKLNNFYNIRQLFSEKWPNLY